MTSKQQTVFFAIHSGLPREAPGDRAATDRAFRAIEPNIDIKNILDIGCGPGPQSLCLADLCDATIFSIDNHHPYLHHLAKNIEKRRLQDRVFPIEADMNQLPFSRSSIDLIWSEGAIYNIGFEKALRLWQPLLKPEGFIVVSELSWIQQPAPKDVTQYWDTAYPNMNARAKNEAILADAGYAMLGSFVLPETGWLRNYYAPIEERLIGLRAKYRNDPQALDVLEAEQEEIDMYRKYSAYYGYVFYIARKTG